MAVFVGYSTQFLAPGMISTARDPRYTKIGTSSKLADLVISGMNTRGTSMPSCYFYYLAGVKEEQDEMQGRWGALLK